ncbi:MBL fold metallo-hydrolase [uncultured Thiodictyon sp.]|uniref:MBL fold metallo-hydrolase n=1 Tax=uncultured Thiodictyon sp. TaxID=1846217 RepID=UPI0025F3F6E0|nr:MBL fold metallo-hydrolase [uncultured Thiodictyon sp.]
MTDYGKGPAVNEVEVTLFGPGFGEAVAIHVGENNWMLVDSCIDADHSCAPASAAYLEALGVSPHHVRAIVASHWHDDHVRGISQLAARYPLADFIISSVFNDKEATSFLAAYSGSVAPGQARGTTELYQVIQQRENVFYVHQRSIILEVPMLGRTIRATALSPVQAAHSQFIAHMAHYLPRKSGGTPISHAPELDPNIEAIATHIDLGDDAILLGSDLEEHDALGWSAVVADKWCSNRKQATAYKVSHHGSYTGDMERIWTTLLQPLPIAALTPFNLGRHKLPTDDDKARIRNCTPHGYISSGVTRKPKMNSTQVKRLADRCKNLSQINPGFGTIRLRKPFGGAHWNVECFANAQRL